MLTDCRWCGAKVSPSAYACPQCGHPFRATPSDQAAGLVMFAVFVCAPAYYWVWPAVRSFGGDAMEAAAASPVPRSSKPAVHCRPDAMASFACTVDNPDAGETRRICWTLTLDCVNGAVPSRHECADVRPKESAKVSIPWVAFANRAACDSVRSSLVLDVATKDPL